MVSGDAGVTGGFAKALKDLPRLACFTGFAIDVSERADREEILRDPTRRSCWALQGGYRLSWLIRRVDLAEISWRDIATRLGVGEGQFAVLMRGSRRPRRFAKILARPRAA
jgi:hypothetical protein